MRPSPMGEMRFPGIVQIEQGSFTLTQGVSPSIATLEIIPQDPSTIPLEGTLTLAFGGKEQKFHNCRIDKASFEYGPSGKIWRLSIYDRRWKWRFAGPKGPISGWFNERFNAIQPAPSEQEQSGNFQLGSLNPDSLLTPQQLASALLDALGEEDYDVSALPNDRLPEAVWDADEPAHILQDLCDRLGCRIVLSLNDTVSICQCGSGAKLPKENIEQFGAVIDPPERPDSIAVVGGRTRYQADFLLVPVGLDVDGTIPYIWDLSYAPVNLLPKGRQQPTRTNLGGWGKVMALDAEFGFCEIAGWEVDEIVPPLVPENIRAAWQVGALSPQINPRLLARQSVFRWYAISMEWPADGSKNGPLIPGWGAAYGDSSRPFPPAEGQDGIREDWGRRLQTLRQILPIEDQQILGWYDNANQFQNFPATVFGQYYSTSWETLNSNEIQKLWDANFNAAQPVPVGAPYSIDRERGIVMFAEPIVLADPEHLGQFLPANLYLRCTVSPRYFPTQAADRFYLERDLGGQNGTGPRILKHEEIVRQVVPRYDKDFKVTELFTNDEEMVAQANYAIDAALSEYQTPTPEDATYMGLVFIGCDGAIVQVGWNVGLSGATTRVSRNTEVHYTVPAYRERVLIGSLSRMNETTRMLQRQARKQ